MATEQFQSFQECIELIEEPRVSGRCVHPLDSLPFLTVAAVISGADGPADIESFGIERMPVGFAPAMPQRMGASPDDL